MTIAAHIFRAYDIRGIADQDLTAEACELIGQAFAVEARQQGQHSVVVGYDGRLSSPTLSAALCRGLLKAGMNVIDIGRVPTPVVYFAAYELNTHTCIAVTGSHNPPQYNGLKMVINQVTLHGPAIQALLSRIEHQDFGPCISAGSLSRQDIRPAYLQRILADVRLKRPLRIAVDSGNGVAGELGPQLLRALGCEVSELYSDIDGHFPNHHPNPSEPENLLDLINTVVSQQLDIGLAFDGDGDRLGVVDNLGNIIWADRQMMLFAEDILQRHPGAKIILDVKSSRRLIELIEQAGGEAIMWKTGHSLMKAKMRETDAVLGGEMSGHLFFRERWYGFDDGLYSAARLLELLAKTDDHASDLFKRLPDSLNTPELTVPFAADGAQFDYMEKLAAKAHFGNGKLTTIDGIRVDYVDGWGLVRASNTTPVLVVRFEADTPQAMQRIQQLFRQQMLAVEPYLQLPF